LGIGPNPQSPIPNPQSPLKLNNSSENKINEIKLYLTNLLMH